MAKSKIEWTDAVWNPVTGCTEISAGCANCYARKMAHRLHGAKNPKYKNDFAVTCHPGELETPEGWKKPRRIFVCSMGDLFHPEVELRFVFSVFNVIKMTPQHTYQILTKRPGRVEKFVRYYWPKNIWLGVTVENRDCIHRLDTLARIPAGTKFISFEPLLEEIFPVADGLELYRFDWIIAGGETGNGARPMETNWVRRIRDECQHLNIPFFLKQMGDFHRKKFKLTKEENKLLDGETWNQFPERNKNVDNRKTSQK